MTTAEIPIQLLICSSFSMKLVIFLAVAHHNTHHSVVCLHVLLQRASIWHRLLRKNTAAHHCAPGTTRTNIYPAGISRNISTLALHSCRQSPQNFDQVPWICDSSMLEKMVHVPEGSNPARKAVFIHGPRLTPR